MTSLSGEVGLLERAIGYALGGLHTITPNALSAPTPCPEWDLRALLDHMNDSLAALYEAIDKGDVTADPVPADGGDDPVATFREGAQRVLGAWVPAVREDRIVTIAGCPMTARLVACAGAVEVAVHGWDIYQACGVSQPIPRALATDLLELSPLLIADADRPSRFAAPVAVSEAGSASDRLVAFLGRNPA
ncbi:MAG TPA: TIGR03086 family metal-binding protein [Streptosporangiaceae bacterium]|jgi:uncharacterized protein (TIGR03086 family)